MDDNKFLSSILGDTNLYRIGPNTLSTTNLNPSPKEYDEQLKKLKEELQEILGDE